MEDPSEEGTLRSKKKTMARIASANYTDEEGLKHTNTLTAVIATRKAALTCSVRGVGEHSSSLRDLKDFPRQKGKGCPPRDSVPF